MRLATGHELTSINVGWPDSHAYPSEMLSHPIAGLSLRYYVLLTDEQDVVAALGLSEAERFWSRYYWLARFAKEWQAVAGYDAGLEQQVFNLFESAGQLGIPIDPLLEVEAAVERDTASDRTARPLPP